MKYFSLFESPSEKFIEISLKKMGASPDDFGNKNHSQEDFFMKSEKYPIFVVADGVTLIQYILDKKDYPDPSPAGDVARIFCETVIKEAEARYDSFEESSIKEIFKTANEAVGEYNKRHGRTKETVDYWDIDFYAATAAFVIIKDNKVYWGSICDSYVVHFDKNGLLKICSPKCDSLAQVVPPKFLGDPSSQKEKTQYTWRTIRNGINAKGERIGYGVVTGEPETLEYLSSESFLIEKGDLIAILTDGFENFIKLPEFVSLFLDWPLDLESQVKKFTNLKAEQDPETFGHERTLIMINND